VISDSVVEGDEVVIGALELEDTVTRVLVGQGAAEIDARAQAAHLVEAELRGHPSHGIRRLPTLAGRVRAGLIVSGSPGCEWVTDSVLRVDGLRGFGPVVARRAIGLIAERAERTGIAVAAMRNTNHIGMLSPYLETLAAGGAIGIIVTTTEGLVHPWGGSHALVGTNPIAIGVPTDGAPLVLDMSTGLVSMGRILDHAGRGLPIPDGWAVDAAGTPTTDAAAASRGAIAPFGGAKGFGLGIAIEAMVGVLTATAFGRDVVGTLDTEHAATKGDLLICIDVGSFGGLAMLPLLTAYLDEVRGDGARIPGDRARAERARRLADGIQLDAALWQRVLALSPDTEHPETENTP
jgi:L-2-hydroxycarboxylate dehydrogenase (NAD+)